MKTRHLKGTLSGNGNKLFRIETRLFHIIHRRFSLKNTPVIINNFNRLEYLKVQIDWLKSAGHTNIYIIDNKSTYSPLIRFYKQNKLAVFQLDRNVGHEAFWRTHIYQRFGNYYHVLTDPDVLPTEKTPTDFMSYFFDLLQQFPGIKKVGFGLKIDDLPDYYPKKKEVITWESQFAAVEIKPRIYKAPIDTTFALYRPGAFFQCWDETLRTGEPYLLRHMPWYENPASLTDEASYYLKETGASSSWYKSLLNEDKRYNL